MGRKRNRNNLEKRGGSADNPRPGRGGPGENWGDDGGARTAPAPLIAVHPTGDLVAVAFGAIVRVYDLKRDRPARLVSEHPADAHAAPPSSAEAPAASPAAADDDDEAKKISAKKMSSSSDDRDHDPRWHAEAVRALRFDPTGRFMLTAGDDKLARVWRVHHNVAFDERSVPGDPATVACGARRSFGRTGGRAGGGSERVWPGSHARRGSRGQDGEGGQTTHRLGACDPRRSASTRPRPRAP